MNETIKVPTVNQVNAEILNTINVVGWIALHLKRLKK